MSKGSMKMLKIAYNKKILQVITFLLSTTIFVSIPVTLTKAAQLVGGEKSNQKLTIDQPIDDSIFFIGDQLQVNSEVNGDIFASGKLVAIRGQVAGNIFAAAAKTVEINGQVEGDIFVFANSLVIGSNAKIKRNVYYIATDITKNPNAEVLGQFYTPEKNVKSFGRRVSDHILATLALLAIGFILVSFLPKSLSKITDTSLDEWGLAILWGVLGLIAVPIMAIILAITRIGLPIGLIIFVFYLIDLYLSTVVIGASLGRILTHNKNQLTWNMVIGVLFIQLLRFMVGIRTVVSIAVLVWGFGSILLGKRALYKHFRHDF